MRNIRITCLLLFSLCSSLISAQISQSLVDADTLTVGSRFKLIVKGDFPIKQVVVPDSIDGFTLIKQETISKKGQNDYSSLVLSPIKPGSLSFPALRVIPSGASGKTYMTDAFRIKVFNVRAESDSILRDIKPLKKYPFQKPWWLYPLLFVPIIIWLAIALVRYFRRKPKDVPLESAVRKVAPTPTAWEKALSELRVLREKPLDSPDHIREYHYGLALILREFLESYYYIPAVEMTSFEIKDAVKDLELSGTVELILFLNYCDRVKFAKYFPEIALIEKNTNWLENYLTGFIPRTIPEPVSGGETDDQAR